LRTSSGASPESPATKSCSFSGDRESTCCCITACLLLKSCRAIILRLGRVQVVGQWRHPHLGPALVDVGWILDRPRLEGALDDLALCPVKLLLLVGNQQAVGKVSDVLHIDLPLRRRLHPLQ